MDTPPTSSSAPTEGCGDCAAEIEPVSQDISALDAVESLDEVEALHDDITGTYTVSIALNSSRAWTAADDERITEIVWRSEIAPIDAMSIGVVQPDGTLAGAGGIDFRRDGAEYAGFEEKWGPRPVE